jgi:hypothetical protein
MKKIMIFLSLFVSVIAFFTCVTTGEETTISLSADNIALDQIGYPVS